MGNDYKIKRFTSLLLLLFSVVFCFAQSASPFKVRYKGYVKGDITLIANNIVNRVDAFHNSNDSYDERSNLAKLNDEFVMDYIDIDNDETTFSSSSANLNLENPSTKKIVYAGLYWSATYPFTSGKQIAVNKFKTIDETRDNFGHIKLKLPHTTTYNDIEGELVYDALAYDFKETAPYAMYADITTLVQSLPNPYGEYMVADIKSAVGKISGGIAAGWSIFFVYEDPAMSGKYINTYDGFAGVTKKPVHINFTGFQAFPEGNVQAKIACMALEGDYSMEGDQLFIKSDFASNFTPISNKIRKEKNLFNSAISLDDNYFINRKPKNTNTLGYDAFIMKISNPENTIIQNNTQSVTIKLETFGERYFVFFNAFSIEVSQPEQELEQLIASNESKQEPILKQNIEITSYKNDVNDIETLQTIKNENQTIAILVEKPITQNNVKTKQEEFNKIKESINLKKPVPIESPSVMIPNQPNGYYTIVNVFAKHSNAIRFVEKLKKQGLKAAYFINPKNKYRYVYLTKHNDFENATAVYNSNFGGKYKDAAWIMTVNKETESNNATIVSIEKENNFYSIREEKNLLRKRYSFC